MSDLTTTDFDSKMEVDCGETLTATDFFCSNTVLDYEEKSVTVSTLEEDDESPLDSMVCDSTSRLIPTGFLKSNCTG